MYKIKPNSPIFLLIIAMLGALPPFAIDTYLPGMPVMAHYFHVPTHDMIKTLSSYGLGFALGMLIWGPCSDRWGRQPILRIGIVLFVISSFISTLSHHENTLVWLRLCQAFADSSCVAMAFAIARDCFSGHKLTQTLATLAMIVMAAPVISPIIGSLLLTHHHWQNVFYFLCLYGVVLFFVVLFLPETYDPKLGVKRFTDVIKYYIEHLSHAKFLLLALATGLTFGAFFSFISASSVIYMTIYHLNMTWFCILFAVNTVSIFLANYCLKHICYQLPSPLIQFSAAAIAILGCCANLIVIHGWHQDWWLFSGNIFITTFGLALLMSSLLSDAINSVNRAFGIATGIVNIMRNASGAIATYIISQIIVNKITPLIYQQLILIFCVISLLVLCRLGLAKFTKPTVTE